MSSIKKKKLRFHVVVVLRQQATNKREFSVDLQNIHFYYYFVVVVAVVFASPTH